ncbi:hypothetical protein CMK22_05540 [Candidatus Poribacteria bacterium]|nr:hypothetical protein [Candidatus Poribacteria bacterium]
MLLQQHAIPYLRTSLDFARFTMDGIELKDEIELKKASEYRHHNYVHKNIILIVILQINFKLFGVVLAINMFGL